MERIRIAIPKPTITIKIKKTSKDQGEIEIGEMSTLGELVGDVKRKTGGRL